MRELIKRISNWWRGYYQPAFDGDLDEPPICQCGHYFYAVHADDRCVGAARDQWARLGRLSWHLKCRCRVGWSPVNSSKEEADA